MLKIEVKSDDINIKTGISQRTNKAYSISEQMAYWHQKGKPYPVEIKISLEDGAGPYKAGFYTVSEESFFVGNFSDLRVGRLKLASVPHARAA